VWPKRCDQWEVAYAGGANVRREKSTESEILETKTMGSKVAGVREGDWISLTHGRGFMLIKVKGLVLINHKDNLYTRVESGSCSSNGQLAITDQATCKAAADALKLKGDVINITDHQQAPDGCYAIDGAAFMSVDVDNRDNGVVGAMQPLCHSHAAQQLEASQEARATVAPKPEGPTSYDGHFTHPAFRAMGYDQWRNMRVHIELFTPTDGTWTALGDTMDVHFVRDGSTVDIVEIDGPTTFAGKIGEDKVIRGEVIQDGVHGGDFELTPSAQTTEAATTPSASPQNTVTTTTAKVQTVTTTTSTWSKSHYPSLFCWSVIQIDGRNAYERDLMQQQLGQGVGIFSCDEFMVLAHSKVPMGKTPGGLEVETTAFQGNKQVSFGDLNVKGTTTSSWLNAQIFINAWDALKGDGRYVHHDWILKADPDTVVLADRVRDRLRANVPGGGTGDTPYFVRNCNKYPPGAMYGSLEVISRSAIELYFPGEVRCRDELHWKGWGEDLYLEQCLLKLGAYNFDDFGMVGDLNCNGFTCQNESIAAFHPFKNVPQWFDCWGQANPDAR